MSNDAKKEFIVLEWHPFILGVKKEIKTVHASWRDQAEKLAKALSYYADKDTHKVVYHEFSGKNGKRKIDSDQGLIAKLAIDEFEKWKLKP